MRERERERESEREREREKEREIEGREVIFVASKYLDIFTYTLNAVT